MRRMMLEQHQGGGGVETLYPPITTTADSSSSSIPIQQEDDHFMPAPLSWFSGVSDDAAFPVLDNRISENNSNSEDDSSQENGDNAKQERDTMSYPVPENIINENSFNSAEQATDDNSGTGDGRLDIDAMSYPVPESIINANSFNPEQATDDNSGAGEGSLDIDNVKLEDRKSSTLTSPKPSLIIASPEHDVEIDHEEPPHSRSSVTSTAARPFPAPSWKELSSQVLPAAARELLSSSLHRVYHTARVSYASSRWRYRKYSDLNRTTSALGYYKVDLPLLLPELPPFSSLPWLDRQLVQEWRTLRHDDHDEAVVPSTVGHHTHLEAFDDVEADFNLSRTLVPALVQRPEWQKSETCAACQRVFGPTRLRHHCRNCGRSFCQSHSVWEHSLPHLGYDVPERVCEGCKRRLEEQCLAERVAWRLARCRDFSNGELSPYFELGIETLEAAALRVTQAALTMARSIPLGAQASVAVETVDVLRKYGLNGIYTVMLRQEFLAAADLLRKALGINRSAWPLSVHELSAAIFYALAQHRALRGMFPDREHVIHGFRDYPTEAEESNSSHVSSESRISSDDPAIYSVDGSAPTEDLLLQTVCDPVPDNALSSLIQYAPLALNFIYVENPVDMQLLAAQQGWRLLYAYLEQDVASTDRPASALFVNDELKTVCIAVRGTSTIQDVVTDIRQVPVPFPDNETTKTEEDWTAVVRGKGVAACGMAGAAMTLYREHIDSLMFLAKRGYRLRLTGHSLGGAVATLLGVLVYRDLERECPSLLASGAACIEEESKAPLRVYAFGTPSCVDEQLANEVSSFVTTVVLHDDCVPRLTPSSCRGLLKHLLHIRETWVKDHLPDDIKAITDRAKTVWAPRWRGSFTLSKSSSKIKRYCRKQLQYGKQKILLVKEKIIGDECGDSNLCGGSGRTLDAIDERAEEYVIDSESSPRASSLFETVTAPGGASVLNDPIDAGDTEPRMLVDYLGGGMETGTDGLVIDGDEFFDPTESLLEENDDNSICGDVVEDASLEPSSPCAFTPQSEERAEVEDEKKAQVFDSPSSGFNGCDDDEEAPGSVVVEETPLPKMFIPGKVVHIYSHRGVYRAAYVPRSFRELRRISMAGNMLSDHKTKSYYEALLEVHSVRKAPEYPPRWTAFDEDNTCSCCASRFTWASTSDSEAQEARDKHNCRSCGTLVCDPCSRNRIPLASIGVTVAVRVCDRCYHDLSGTLSSKSQDPSIVVNVIDGQLERQRERRSAVVDDLAYRIHRPRAAAS